MAVWKASQQPLNPSSLSINSKQYEKRKEKIKARKMSSSKVSTRLGVYNIVEENIINEFMWDAFLGTGKEAKAAMTKLSVVISVKRRS